MKMSQKGIDLLIQNEGSVKDKQGYHIIYLCPAGKKTIGYGHTGEDVKNGMRLTEEQARELLMLDIKRFEEAVNSELRVEVSQGLFDALVDTTFNIGVKGFSDSTFLRYVNAGKSKKEIADAIRMWNKSTDPKTKQKVYNEGLAKRRERVIKLFISD